MRQNGLPVLNGRRAGLGAWPRFNAAGNTIRDSDILAGDGLVDPLLPISFTFRFRARRSQGFEIAKPARQPCLAVTVYDSRIDRRLMHCFLADGEIRTLHQGRSACRALG